MCVCGRSDGMEFTSLLLSDWDGREGMVGDPHGVCVGGQIVWNSPPSC